MPPDEPQKISEWYDNISGTYEELYETEQSKKHQLAFDLLGGQRFGLVLDVGCGTGALLERMKDSYSRAVGLDLSLGMLEKAKKQAKSERIDFMRADCSSLPIREDMADCVLSMSVLNSATAANEQLSELQRTTKAGGTLIVTIFHPETEAQPTPTVHGTIERRTTLSRRESLYMIRRHASRPARRGK